MSATSEGDSGKQLVDAVIELRSEQELASAIFTREFGQRGLRELLFLSRAAETKKRDELDRLGETIWSRQTPIIEERVLLTSDGCVARIFIGQGTVDIVAAGKDRPHARKALDALADVFREAEEEPSQVPVTFWSGSKDGARCAHRRIECPAWSEIDPGYGPQARATMRRLIEAREPEGARLILWHGPPGTGKTHAIRALAREWQDWCAFHLITDPENYLEFSTYALEVLTRRDLEPRRQRKWNIVVLEDSGELLRNDAREKTGQALSRLLNLTDGLLGQGLNALVLITTNEPIGRLHPAVTRPGRCLENAEFGDLPTKQANKWLEEAESEHRVKAPTSLATLYAFANNLADPNEIQSNLPTIGFAAT